MQFLAVLLFSFLVFSVAAKPGNQTSPIERHLKIPYGYPRKIEDYPFAVSMRKYYDGSVKHHCTASIIGVNWILTAAHCVCEHPICTRLDTIIPDYVLVYGATKVGPDADQGAIYNSITKAHIHPDFNAKRLNDIALIKTKDTIKFSNKVKPVHLWKNVPSYNLDRVEIIGWGVARPDADTLPDPNLLLGYTTKILPAGECDRFQMLCAKAGPLLDHGAGDSGGPVVTRVQMAPPDYTWVQVALVRSGYPDVTQMWHNMNTEIAPYCDWIFERPAPTFATGALDNLMKIVGGGEKEIIDYPFMVSFLNTRNGKMVPNPYCGGSIIAERWVLTAAHCFRTSYDKNGEPVVMGSTNVVREFSPGKQQSTILNIYQHPDFKPIVADTCCDIAIVELSSWLNYTDSVSPLKLWKSPIPANSEIEILGWGRRNWTTPSSPHLFGFKTTLIPEPTCDGADAQQICFRTDAAGSVCMGDSGGPVVSKITQGDGNGFWAQIGVISGTSEPNCGFQREHTGVAVDIIPFCDWIQQGDSGGPVAAEVELFKRRKFEWVLVGVHSQNPQGDCKFDQFGYGIAIEVSKYCDWIRGMSANDFFGILTIRYNASHWTAIAGTNHIDEWGSPEQQARVDNFVKFQLIGPIAQSIWTKNVVLWKNVPWHLVKEVELLGWGRTAADSDTSAKLQGYYTRKVPDERCREARLSTMFCTATGPVIGTCMGDSGGPIIARLELFKKRFEYVQLAVATRVDAYCEWIRTVTGTNFCYEHTHGVW
ncbi:unnamed protein product, partial [Mesorhabditis spiculigera]